ncbi:MAG TPA: hypothetical protein PL143_12720 [Rhodocyclaceae bacterium]|nr:hypothetical protein [Rhodocyclaceae bacterium]
MDDMIARAYDRGRSAAAVEPRAIGARFEAATNRLVLELEGGVELSMPASALGFARAADLSGVRVEGGGFDLYFPNADEGIFIPDLVRAAIEHRLAA